MRITMLYFARARELAGRGSEGIEIPDGSRVSALLDALRALHPGLGRELSAMRVAVNQEFSDADAALADGAEVALVPPVSGGAPEERAHSAAAQSASAQLQHDAIAIHAAEALLRDDVERRGALATFAGIVRAHSHQRMVTHLQYEAYEPMALRELERILAAAKAQWPILDAAVVHRLGRLEIGDVAVSIAVSSMHRAEAFDACRFIIEELKRDVPIWKKETDVDGDEHWGKGP